MKIIPQAYAQIDLGNITGPGKYMQDPQDPALFENLFSTVIGFLTVTAGLAFILYFLIGALQWITSGGDKAKVEQAQKQITNGLTGLVIVLVAYFAIAIIGNILDIQLLEPLKLLDLS